MARGVFCAKQSECICRENEIYNKSKFYFLIIQPGEFLNLIAIFSKHPILNFHLHLSFRLYFETGFFKRKKAFPLFRLSNVLFRSFLTNCCATQKYFFRIIFFVPGGFWGRWTRIRHLFNHMRHNYQIYQNFFKNWQLFKTTNRLKNWQ